MGDFTYGFNILLDPLPEEWNGIPIDSDFQIGLQMFWALENDELSEYEKIAAAGNLLFGENMPQSLNEVGEAVGWFLCGWNTDNLPADRAEAPSVDYNKDQWRIWAAFKKQYNIDLNREKLHFWAFMALLRNLEECSFTRVIDIRTKKITGKMSAEEKKYYQEQKKIYALGTPANQYSEEEKEKIDVYDRLISARRSAAEKKRINEFMRYAECQEDMTEV